MSDEVVAGSSSEVSAPVVSVVGDVAVPASPEPVEGGAWVSAPTVAAPLLPPTLAVPSEFESNVQAIEASATTLTHVLISDQFTPRSRGRTRGSPWVIAVPWLVD